MAIPIGIEELARQSEEIQMVLNAYAEIERVYKESLAAMGYPGISSNSVANSAEISISFKESPTSSDIEVPK